VVADQNALLPNFYIHAALGLLDLLFGSQSLLLTWKKFYQNNYFIQICVAGGYIRADIRPTK